MKTKKTTKMSNIKYLIVILYFLILPFVSFADDPPPIPPDPPPCPIGNDPVVTPIEDGVPVVLFLALLYGVFTLSRSRKVRENTELAN